MVQRSFRPSSDTRPVVVISTNAAWNIVNFRLGLVRALSEAGFRMVAITPVDRHAEDFGRLGIEHRPIRMANRGLSPRRDLATLYSYWRLLGQLRPAAYLGFTIKPNIWGSLAAQLRGVRTINNIAGLGETFRTRGALYRLVRFLYRIALARSHTVFFQNPDDRTFFVNEGIVPERKTCLLPGSGIDLARFAVPDRAPPAAGEPFVFLLVARMLWAKGIEDFVEAARIVRAHEPQARFRLLGIMQDGPDAIAPATVETWVADGVIEFLGAADDVRPHVANADCVVLPTFYPEGTPRSLLEAAAMGRPLIATDVPGCREVIADGINGFLVPPRAPQLLADRMLSLIRMSVAERESLGRSSRRRAEEMFDEQIVIDRYLSALA